MNFDNYWNPYMWAGDALGRFLLLGSHVLFLLALYFGPRTLWRRRVTRRLARFAGYAVALDLVFLALGVMVVTNRPFPWVDSPVLAIVWGPALIGAILWLLVVLMPRSHDALPTIRS